jgi:hypothetical protein
MGHRQRKAAAKTLQRLSDFLPDGPSSGDMMKPRRRHRNGRGFHHGDHGKRSEVKAGGAAP